MSKLTFDKLRNMSGSKLTQSQVDETNQAINATSQNTVNSMLGVGEEKVTSENGVNLICGFEGLRLNAYDDGV